MAPSYLDVSVMREEKEEVPLYHREFEELTVECQTVDRVFTGPRGGMELNFYFYHDILFNIGHGRAVTSYLLLD